MNKKLENFTTVDSVYGQFIVNRHCQYQAEALIKTGKTHIEVELNNMRIILQTLPNNCVVIDGGANIGFVAVPVAQFLQPKNGIVYAFEPQRMIFNALAGTIALNEINNLFLEKKALGDKKGFTFVPPVDYGKPADFGTVELGDNEQGEAVEIITVDSLNLERLDFFKLDVEGYEVLALQGAKKTIKQFEPWCWVEYWKIGHDSIMECFKGLDYKFYLMGTLNMLCAPVTKLDSSGLSIANEITLESQQTLTEQAEMDTE
jgi:FkbM family methyltransferase